MLTVAVAPALLFLEKKECLICLTKGRLRLFLDRPQTLQNILLQEIFWTCMRRTLGHSEGHFVAGWDSVEASEDPPPLAASSVGSSKANIEAQMSSFINGRSKKSLYDDFAYLKRFFA